MKSARKLIVTAAWLKTTTLLSIAALSVMMLGGCLESNFGIARPFGIQSHAPASSGDPIGDTSPTNSTVASGDLQTQRDSGLAASGESEESSDPRVIALTKQIENLTTRSTHPSKNSAVDVGHEQRAPVQADPTAHQPPASAQVKPVVSAPNNARIGVNAPADVALASNDGQAANVDQNEVVASPTPRPIPIVQPTEATSDPQAVATTANIQVEITDIRPVLSISAVAGGSKTASANQAAESNGNARAADIKDYITQIEKMAEQQPPQLEDTLRLRLLYLAAGDDEKAVEPIKDMDPVQSELLTAIVKTVASSRQAMTQRTDSNATPSALSAADDLRRLLAQQSGISIPRMALVTRVTSFGDYEAISPTRFKAGTEIRAYVYTEITNFRSEPTDDGRLHTLLSEKVQVFDSSGKVVWERSENNIEDRVRTPRRDFFIPFPVHLPATLTPGDYVLKVTIEDRIGGTTDQQRLSFSIQ